MKIDISIIVGTRPQIIKIQPLFEELKKEGFKTQIVNTGQHYDYELSKKMFQDLRISKPTLSLDVGSATSLQQIAKIVPKLEKFFKNTQPDLVIIPGDTTSALAGALTASKCKIKLAHLEAGARSNQFNMPEEINRRLIDHCSDVLFAPTRNCLQNLKNELVYGKSFFVGDTMYDLFLYFQKKLNLKKKKIQSKQILITIHRVENIEQKLYLKNICRLIKELDKRGFHIIFPLHPHTRKMLKKFRFSLGIDTIKPIGYFDVLKTLAESCLVITDSGGLQKESFWMGTPCVTLREKTEWVETVNAKSNFLFSPNKKIPLRKIEKISQIKFKPNKALFGNGKASEKISVIIRNLY